MISRLFTAACVLSLLLCLATVVLWIMPISPWPNHGRGTFFLSVEKHRILRLNILRPSASPVVSPPQENTRAFVRWQLAIPSGPSFEFLGFRVAHSPWFTGSVSAGHQFLTHVGTNWSVDAPFLGLFLLFALPSAVKLFVFVWRRWPKRSRVGYCSECKYDLAGNTSGVCPECGTPIRQESVSISG